MDTPSRSSDGALKVVLTTGSALTPGANHGENLDSSRLSKETQASMSSSTLAHQMLLTLLNELTFKYKSSI